MIVADFFSLVSSPIRTSAAPHPHVFSVSSISIIVSICGRSSGSASRFPRALVWLLTGTDSLSWFRFSVSAICSISLKRSICLASFSEAVSFSEDRLQRSRSSSAMRSSFSMSLCSSARHRSCAVMESCCIRLATARSVSISVMASSTVGSIDRILSCSNFSCKQNCYKTDKYVLH